MPLSKYNDPHNVVIKLISSLKSGVQTLYEKIK